MIELSRISIYWKEKNLPCSFTDARKFRRSRNKWQKKNNKKTQRFPAHMGK